jgi:hypothetical protein
MRDSSPGSSDRGDLTSVYVPTIEDEGVRDLSRARNEQTERVQRLEDELVEIAAKWPLHPLVERFQAIRGVQGHTAMMIAAKLGDLTRFENPRQFAASVGLIPGEYSSGDSRRLGPITRAATETVAGCSSKRLGPADTLRRCRLTCRNGSITAQ